MMTPMCSTSLFTSTRMADSIPGARKATGTTVARELELESKSFWLCSIFKRWLLTDLFDDRNVNIPWPDQGMGDSDYMFAFQQVVMPIALEFDPDLVIGKAVTPSLMH